MDCMADLPSVKLVEDHEPNGTVNKHPNTPPRLSPLVAPSSSTISTSSQPKKTSKRLAKELTPCRMLLDELEEQEESWPFLLPVNTKQFPTYRKIIRWPMDLSTIKKKLIDGQSVQLHFLLSICNQFIWSDLLTFCLFYAGINLVKNLVQMSDLFSITVKYSMKMILLLGRQVMVCAHTLNLDGVRSMGFHIQNLALFLPP